MENSIGMILLYEKNRPDGRKYKGQWKNGKQEGKGIFVAPDGQEKEGTWKEGSKIEWI